MSEMKSIRVLHVDDEPGLADVSAEMLEREDEAFDVESATSAAEGLERLDQSAFDCVISDYDMPEQNGIDFLETVRESAAALPFILFTGKGSEEVASEAFSAGATDYLRKKGGTGQYELLANRVRNAVDQYRSQRRASELDRIRTLVSEVNKALVRADSRADAETHICEIFSESDPYLFAWIGEVDRETDEIEPRAWAGVEKGYLDEIQVSVAPDADTRGPGWRAVHEERVAVSQDVTADPTFEQWRGEATTRGYRAVAAVPLVYDDRRYGVLGLYAAEPDAFDEGEKELLAELGDDIAHAFHSFDVRERLRTERDRRTVLFENAPVPVIASEMRAGDHRITDVNAAFEDRFGYDGDEVVGRDPAEVVVPEDDQDRHETFRKRATSGEPILKEVERVTIDGRRTFLLHVIPSGVEDDGVDTMYAWYTDIAEREARSQAIEALHSTARTFIEAETVESVAERAVESVAERAVEAASDVLDLPASTVHLYDAESDTLPPVAWTERVEEIVGKPPAFDGSGSIAWRAFETDEPQVHDDVTTVPERRNYDTDVRSQIVLPLEDHGVFLIGSDSPGEFDDMDVSLAQTLATHVTTALGRVEREEELARHRSVLESQQEAMIDGILVVDEDGRIVSYNDQFLELWGLSQEVVEQDNHAEALEMTLEKLEDPDGYREVIEYRYDHPDERSRDEIRLADGRVFDRYTTPLTDEDGTYYGRLWTFRDITDRTERERELERYEAYLQESNDIITVLDDSGQIQYQSPSVTRILGYESGVLLGENGFDFIHPDDVDAVYETFSDLVSNPGKTITVECRFRTVDDEWRWLEVRGTNHFDHPVIDGIVTNNRDITDRKRRERQLQRQNQRLEEFASVVSHDLRNPLNVAQGRLELAQEECDSDQLDGVASALDRSQGLIDDLLTLARDGDQVSDTDPVDLPAVVDGCWENVETANATLVTDTTMTVAADPSRLKQLLENLLRNAIDHGGEDVTVTIGDHEDGFYVADDGSGIPSDEREQVFETGYSTTQDGTGFGLSIVADIADAHGWEITLTESDDGGARFEITDVDTADP